MPVVIVQLYTAQLLIVNQYLAAIRLKQSGQKLYQRGFAGAAASRQGNFFAGGYRKGKTPQNLSSRIGKIQLLHHNIPMKGCHGAAVLQLRILGRIQK